MCLGLRPKASRVNPKPLNPKFRGLTRFRVHKGSGMLDELQDFPV